MKKVFFVVSGFILCVLLLCACNGDSPEPPEEDRQIYTIDGQENPVQQPSLPLDETAFGETKLPDDFDVVSPSTPSPVVDEVSEAEDNLWEMQNLISTFSMVYATYELPTFYPVSDATLNDFRDFLTDINENYGQLYFDIYSIEPCTYGYKVALDGPMDYQGNSYYLWFEVVPDDTTIPRVTVVGVGPDGELTYQGFGADYSVSGFGDDVVQFITFDF